MDFSEILFDSFRVIKFTVYPMLQLYGYFVFVGLFCLEDKKFDDGIILILFFFYHILATTKVIFYMKILINEGVSTIEIFPNIPLGGFEHSMKGINVFLKEDIMNKNITKVKSCSICKTYKPPRSHHCSVCNRCFLKYDHHCSVLDTCIGFHNYKFFYQFLILNVITTGFFIIVIGIAVFKKGVQLSLRVNYIVSFSCFVLQLLWVVVMLIFHSILISNNETTVEFKALNSYINGDHRYAHVFQEGPITVYSTSDDRTVLNPYNLGRNENWEQVFGRNKYDWFKPNSSSKGDGISFHKNYNEFDLV